MGAEEVELQGVVGVLGRARWWLELDLRLPCCAGRLGAAGVEELAPGDGDQPALRLARRVVAQLAQAWTRASWTASSADAKSAPRRTRTAVTSGVSRRSSGSSTSVPALTYGVSTTLAGARCSTTSGSGLITSGCHSPALTYGVSTTLAGARCSTTSGSGLITSGCHSPALTYGVSTTLAGARCSTTSGSGLIDLAVVTRRPSLTGSRRRSLALAARPPPVLA